jgi:putative endonuclease
MVVLDRNWRCPQGELDIVARDGATVVFCEIKTRRTATFGTPAEAIGAARVGRLRAAAQQWVLASGLTRAPMRFDVVSVRPQESGPALVEHLRDAF